MGSQNARQVEAMMMARNPRVKGIQPGPLLVLLVMAFNARDDATEHGAALLYFRGWDHLAAILGYPEWDRTAERTVARHVAELVGRGLITPTARRGKHGPRVYVLHLSVPPAMPP